MSIDPFAYERRPFISKRKGRPSQGTSDSDSSTDSDLDEKFLRPKGKGKAAGNARGKRDKPEVVNSDQEDEGYWSPASGPAVVRQNKSTSGRASKAAAPVSAHRQPMVTMGSSSDEEDASRRKPSALASPENEMQRKMREQIEASQAKRAQLKSKLVLCL